MVIIKQVCNWKFHSASLALHSTHLTHEPTSDFILWLLHHTEKFPKSERFRLAVRLAHARQLTSREQYGYAANALTEIGKLLGGWIKTTAA